MPTSTHRFALVEVDGVAVWDEDETVPPLPVLLQVLEQAPGEDGVTRQRVLEEPKIFR